LAENRGAVGMVSKRLDSMFHISGPTTTNAELPYVIFIPVWRDK